MNRSESTLFYIWQHFPVNNQSTEYTDGSNIFLVIFILSFFLVTKMTFLLNTSKELATLSFTIITYRIGYQSYQNLNIGNNFSNFYGFSSSVRSSDTFFDAGLDLAYNISCSIPMRKSKTHLLQTTSISVTVFQWLNQISLYMYHFFCLLMSFDFYNCYVYCIQRNEIILAWLTLSEQDKSRAS